MNNSAVRVRFAPAPTGMMHLGNVRSALMNYLFAQQKNGTFVLRIEDTDAERNYDPQAKEIIADLAWLGIFHTEGPQVGGKFGPYFQSERNDLYRQALAVLIKNEKVYRCFCTEEQLEKKRQRQIALKQPPRYDRTCIHLTAEQEQENNIKNIPFIWRFRLDEKKSVTIKDLAHGQTIFELKNFSDFPLTRSDGSFTFIFANFVDDMLMQITHIFRGEDHLSNSACQAALFDAFGITLPLYWHQPILCNVEGKKLSKRDFGFSLRDLQKSGFLPEAIINYLAIIGGSFEKEYMTKSELVNAIKFDHLSTTGQIKYDIEKLTWLNRKWIMNYEPTALTDLCLPFLKNAYPESASLTQEKITLLIQAVKTEMATLADCVQQLAFYFALPKPTYEQFSAYLTPAIITKLSQIINANFHLCTTPESFLQTIKKDAQEQEVGVKDLYCFLRIALTTFPHGPAITELIDLLSIQTSKERISKALTCLKEHI